MSRNIELKARLPDLPDARRRAEALGAQWHGVERQRDSYFRVSAGRLKLRQRWVDGASIDNQLLFYQRHNDSQAKGSDYILTTILNADGLLAMLSNRLGTLVVVDKTRTIFLHDNVRIHLDEVERLGTFLEFEAIVDGSCTDAQAHHKLARLREHFALRAEQLVAVSYSDLLLGA